MKRFDLVKLISDKDYLINGLTKGMHGIVVESFNDTAKILFFNPQNAGDYIPNDIKIEHLILEKEKLPQSVQEELNIGLNEIISKAKNIFGKIEVNDYDEVELLVEDDKYTRFGIHKGFRGYVMDSNAIKNHIEVDFSYTDKAGNLCGECISVNIKDIKIIKKL